MAAKPLNITIIQVHATTSDYNDEAIEAFYEDLRNTINNSNKKDFFIVQGDWNAKVGPDAYSQWAGTVGRCSLGETNDRGYRLGFSEKPCPVQTGKWGGKPCPVLKEGHRGSWQYLKLLLQTALTLN